MKKLLPLFILPLLFGGCQTVQKLAKNIRKPTLSVTNVRVTDFSFKQIELNYSVKVNNPNPVALHMLSYDYNFKINGNSFVRGNHKKRLEIASSGSSTFQIPMAINFQDLYNLFNSLRSKGQAGYQLRADLHFNLPVLGDVKIPLKKSGMLPMIKLPKVQLSNIKLKNINLSKANLVLNLKVHNPNAFGLLMNALSYGLDVNGKNLVNGSQEKQLTINKNTNQTISVPVSLNILNIGSSVIKLLSNSGKLNYHLKGHFNFGAEQPLLKNLLANFHFDQSGKVPIVR
jgi:LEA14-like dessication related protein